MSSLRWVIAFGGGALVLYGLSVWLPMDFTLGILMELAVFPSAVIAIGSVATFGTSPARAALRFFEGVMAFVWVAILEFYLLRWIGPTPKRHTTVTCIVAAACEELFKMASVARTLKEADAPVGGACFSAGLAMLENIFFVMAHSPRAALMRAFLSVPMHCATGTLLGVGLARAKRTGKWGWACVYYLTATTIHFLFDLGAFMDGSVAILAILLMAVLGWLYFELGGEDGDAQDATILAV